MSEAITAASKAIETRLTEIRDERKRLERALSSLSDAPQQRRSRKRSGSGAAGRGRSPKRRAGRGERPNQLLASVKAHPNYRPADHARELGMAPSQIYGLINRMIKGGQLTRKNGALTVVKAD